MITRSFQTDVKTQFKASRQIFFKTTGAKLFFGFFIGLPLILLVLKLYLGKGFTELEFGIIPTWLLILLLFAYPLAFTPMAQYLQIRKAFNSNPSAQKKQNYEISEKGVKNFGEGFSVELGWKSIPRIELSKDFVLLFISNNCAYYLPRDLVSNEEYQQFQSWKKLNRVKAGFSPALPTPPYVRIRIRRFPTYNESQPTFLSKTLIQDQQNTRSTKPC